MESSSKLIKMNRQSVGKILADNAIYLIMIGIFIIFAIFLRDKGFLTGTNIMNVFRQTAVISILAVGFTFIIAAGEFDLSISSTIAISSLVGAIILRKYGIPLALISSISLGAFIGLINGALVVKVKMPSFLATLATQGIIYGFARWMTNLQAVPVSNKTFAYIFGAGNIGPIPTLFIWTIIAVIIGHLIMTKTGFGRKVLAVGGNKTAATFSGINVANVKWLLFIVMGAIAAFAGLLYAGRLSAGRYSFGESDVFTVVAAVVIGGNSLYGGKGIVIGTLIGSVILGMINNGLILFGFTVDQQLIFRGVIILIAVALSSKD